MLSFLYRLMNRLKSQDDLTQDMQLTFEEARAEARRAGWWSYLKFAAREIGGLFHLPSAKSLWIRVLGWSLAGLAAGWIASALMREHRGCCMNVVIGSLGALLGGIIFHWAFGLELEGLSFLWSLLVAVVGSLVLLALAQAARGARYRG